MSCPDWYTAVHSLRLQRPLWIYCPGHAGVSGDERTDRLASTANITSGLQLGRAELLRGLRYFLNMDRPEHHSTDRLKERGLERGRGRHCTLRGRARSVFNQTNIDSFEGNLGETAETGRSAYGPFRALLCYLELKLKLYVYMHVCAGGPWGQSLVNRRRKFQ